MLEKSYEKNFNFYIFTLFSWCGNNKDKRTKEAILKAIQKEALYAKEQTFYDYENYDFNDSKVNEDSLPFVPSIEVEDLDMDDVYN